jgi:DNA-binding IclR family transcriptional regulator
VPLATSELDRLDENLKQLTSNTVIQRDEFNPQLAEIRRRGYAITVDELEEGFTAVATIIRGVLGDVQGALSIGGPTQRLNATRRAELGTSLCRAAQRLNPEF